ncbi:MAG: hypothetical protein AB1465_05775 [Patescibacteria group bacterium]
MERIIIFIIRFLFLGLLSFEGANLAGILKFTLEFSWLGLFLTALAVWLGLELLAYFSKKKYQYNFPVFIFLIPAFNILFDAIGDTFHWYSKFSWYDQAMHFSGGAAGAAVIFFILRVIFLRQKILSARFIAFIAFLISNFFGILYELEEYFESFFLHNNRLGGRFDTPNDLFFNMIGALVGVLLAILIVQMKKKKGLSGL